MLYVLKKEYIEHARLRALAQAVVNKEKSQEVFEDYMKAAFPWLETQKSRDKEEHMRILNEEIKRGGLSIVQPLWMKNPVKSRLKTKVVDRAAVESEGDSRARMDRVYSKLGKIIAP